MAVWALKSTRSVRSSSHAKPVIWPRRSPSGPVKEATSSAGLKLPASIGSEKLKVSEDGSPSAMPAGVLERTRGPLSSGVST